MAVKVENEKAEKRFQAKVDGSLAILEYELDEQAMTLTHTRVPPELEGQGLGSKLAKAALDHARDKGLRVRPQCPFVARYIERHEEYRDLVE